ncbi:hypothetical protein [Endozoicomonas sp.]|uniref:hypothetical protein n=1 Tax=Endozoicomonas sp. TaxID=1892382 RepID=UPI0028849D3A|nr:hypothetical protein [Endozoicomonas sp.]
MFWKTAYGKGWGIGVFHGLCGRSDDHVLTPIPHTVIVYMDCTQSIWQGLPTGSQGLKA